MATIILFLVILALLILVHEIGHFTVAKIFGIRVDEFGLGLPPRAVGKKLGETIYSLNWIPFGGFVRIFGENPDEESLEGPESSRSFARKGKWIQTAVLAAGVGGNFVFAWLLISIGFISGLPTPVDYQGPGRVENPRLVITSVLPHSPAEAAGLKTGDRLTSLGANGATIQTPTVDRVEKLISESVNAISIGYTRGAVSAEAVVNPNTRVVPGKKAIGISMDMIGTLRLPFFEAIVEGARTTVSLTKDVALGIGHFLLGALTGHADFSQVTGPVGIAGMVGDARALGFIFVLSFTALISINLAIINLIPFPALDGGRLFFVLIEAIKGSPIKPKIANTFNTVGFALLILLMLLITFHDIAKLF